MLRGELFSRDEYLNQKAVDLRTTIARKAATEGIHFAEVVEAFKGAEAYARIRTEYLRDAAADGGPTNPSGLPANPLPTNAVAAAPTVRFADAMVRPATGSSPTIWPGSHD